MRRTFLVVFAALAACAGSAGDSPAAAVRSARFVLLGETHDNPEHHRQRAAMLRELLADGRPTRVVFEQMERGREAAIAAAPREPDAIVDAGRLDRTAWRWPLHRPLVEAALEGGATVVGGNLPRDDVRAVVRDGLSAVPANLRPLLDDGRWSRPQQDELERLIDHGHCSALPPDRLAPMALAQRARDAAMARVMLDAAQSERVVLIAGNGHVRKDIGVPHYLRAAGVPDGQIAAVGYLEEGEGGNAPFDATRYTPPAERPDPCAQFRR